jgi:uncharacterized protein (TIGR00730 family)
MISVLRDKTPHFRVVVFGSARIERGDPSWDLIFNLAKRVATEGMDLVTGGGPGLMEAASEGHYAGDLTHTAHSIGLQIKLPKEQRDARHLDIKKEFFRFSTRLDNFMELAHAVVVAPGGVGTLLELFYTWQLMQVKMMHGIPIILLGDMWMGFLDWIRRHPLKNELLNEKDVELLFLVNSCEEAMDIIKRTYEKYRSGK